MEIFHRQEEIAEKALRDGVHWTIAGLDHLVGPLSFPAAQVVFYP
jgi:hypothetical protein